MANIIELKDGSGTKAYPITKTEAVYHEGTYPLNTLVTSITPAMYGAVGDGVADDSDNLQAALDAAVSTGKKLVSPGNLRYKITKSLQVKGKIEIDFHGAEIFATTSDAVFNVNQILVGNTYSGFMSNVTINCNGVSQYGIYSTKTKRFVFRGLKIINCPGYGFYFPAESSYAARIKDCYLDNGSNVYTNSTVLYTAASDLFVDVMDWINYKYGIYHVSGNAIYNDCHGFIYNESSMSSMYPGSYFAKIEGAFPVIFNNPYPDTQQYGFYINDVAKVKINGLENFTNTGVITDNLINTYGKTYLFYFTGNEQQGRRITLLNGSFRSPTTSGGTQIIEFSNVPSTLMRRNLALVSTDRDYVSGIQTTLSKIGDFTVVKNKLVAGIESASLQYEFVYNPSQYSKLSRTFPVSIEADTSASFARLPTATMSPANDTWVVAPYGIVNTNDQFVERGYVYIGIAGRGSSDSPTSNGGRLLIRASSIDYNENTGICDTSTSTDYHVLITTTWTTVHN